MEDFASVDDTMLGIDDLAAARRELKDVEVYWKGIGLELGIRVLRLDAIETEATDCMERLTKMLTMWLKLDYSFEKHQRPSWRRLVEAVAQPTGGENRGLAMEIAKRHPVSPASPTVEQATLNRKSLSKQGAVEEEDGEEDETKRLVACRGSSNEIQYDAQSIASVRSEELQALQKQHEEQMTLILQQQLQVTAKIQELQEEVNQLHPKSEGGDSSVKRLTEERGSIVSPRHDITLSWELKATAPCVMSRGTCAPDDRTLFVRPYNSRAVYACDLMSCQWSPPNRPFLPDCPVDTAAFAIVKGLLTAIGGHLNCHATNALHCLVGREGEEKTWCAEVFPPMPTKRWNTAAACTEKSLIVAGGVGGFNEKFRHQQFGTDAVEVMDVDNRQWFVASSLPQWLYQASLTICQDTVYLLGAQKYGYESERLNKLVLYCSLENLLNSCRAPTFTAKLKSALSVRKASWHKAANMPRFNSTCASLHDKLLAVGGEDEHQKRTDAIYMYNPVAHSWEIISHLSSPRSLCLVAVLPDDTLMVVGGWRDMESGLDAEGRQESNTVEVFHVKPSVPEL